MLHSYFSIINSAFKKGFIYQISNVLSIINRIIEVSVLIFIWKAIYNNSTVIGGMNLATLTIYYALIYSISQIMTWGINEEIGESIKKGTISMELLYPVAYTKYFFCYKIGYVLRQLLVVSFPSFILLMFLFKISFTVNLINLGLSILILILSVIIVFFIEFIFGLMTFYTNSEWGLQVLKKSLITILSGAIAPITFFPDTIQKIIHILPFQDLLYSPITTLLGINSSSDIIFILCRQGIWIGLLWIASKLFYSYAIKNVTIYGG